MFFNSQFLFYFLISSSSFEQRLETLSHLNSGSYNEQGLSRVAKELEIDLKSLGSGPTWNLEKRNLSATVGRQDAQHRVLLVGHLDTVFEEFHPFQTVTREGSKMIGPGVADAKGGILLLFDLIRKNAVWTESGKVQWRVFIAADEETGSKLSRESLESFAEGSEVALVFEPGWYDLELKRERVAESLGGNFSLEIVVTTPQSHSGTSQKKGYGPIDVLAMVASRLGNLRGKTMSIHFFEINSKSKANVAGGEGRLKASIRFEKASDKTSISNLLNDLKRTMSRQNSIDLKWEEKEVWAPQPLASLDVMRVWDEVHRRAKRPVALRSISMARDASSFLALKGIPVLDSAGPLGFHYHSDQEEIWLDSVDQRLSDLTEFLRLYLKI